VLDTQGESTDPDAESEVPAGGDDEAGRERRIQRMCVALEELIFFVEDLDNANDLRKLDSEGRAVATVVALLGHADPRVCHWAAWVVSTIAQNNPRGQADVLLAGAWPLLMKLLATEDAEYARNKEIGAISALMSAQNADTAADFFARDGLALLRKFAFHASTAPTRARTLFLVGRLASEFPGQVFGGAHGASDTDMARKKSPICASGLIPLALAGALERDANLRDHAVAALAALAADAAVRRELRDLGAKGALERSIDLDLGGEADSDLRGRVEDLIEKL
jgi:hypothetical protein